MIPLTQTKDLEGDKLDHCVALALGWKIVMWGDKAVWVQASGEGRFRCNVKDWHPSTNPAQSWPIIESKNIDITPYTGPNGSPWRAYKSTACIGGPTSLIAAMRCFVASVFGEEFLLAL